MYERVVTLPLGCEPDIMRQRQRISPREKPTLTGFLRLLPHNLYRALHVFWLSRCVYCRLWFLSFLSFPFILIIQRLPGIPSSFFPWLRRTIVPTYDGTVGCHITWHWNSKIDIQNVLHSKKKREAGLWRESHMLFGKQMTLNLYSQTFHMIS